MQYLLSETIGTRLPQPFFVMKTKKLKFLFITITMAFAAIFLYNGFKKVSKSENIHTKGNLGIKDSTLNLSKNSTPRRDSIVAFALNFLGKPYVAAGCSEKGFDCSGFVYFVFKHFNIIVPRSSSQYKNFGKEIPIDSVKKGDVLVFLSPTRNEIGHLGIVTNPNGMESDFIHASSGGEMKVIPTSLKKAVYTRRFVKAVSVL